MSKQRKKKKKGIRTLESDQDYLKAFTARPGTGETSDSNSGTDGPRMNRHGIPIVEEIPFWAEAKEEEDPGVSHDRTAPDESDPVELCEDFSLLLEDSFKTRPIPKKKVADVPLKKRLKRYPGPEAELDLHGYNAIGAEARARSFIDTCRHQGYFTLRLIVGKGLHSPEGPVLPHVVEDLLKIMKKEKIILSFSWERNRGKKSGAFIVYLNQFND